MMDFTIVVMEGAFASGVTVTLDVLTVAVDSRNKLTRIPKQN